MGKASQLYKERKILKYWSYNGIVNIIEREGQDPKKILHMQNIDHFFDDFSSESAIDFSWALYWVNHFQSLHLFNIFLTITPLLLSDAGLNTLSPIFFSFFCQPRHPVIPHQLHNGCWLGMAVVFCLCYCRVFFYWSEAISYDTWLANILNNGLAKTSFIIKLSCN